MPRQIVMSHGFGRMLVALVVWMGASVAAQQHMDITLLPKYGLVSKTPAQKAQDADFIKAIDQHFNGDRQQGAADAARRGWEYVRAGNLDDAMRRFNQSWLLDADNGSALWGMAVVEGINGQPDSALRLFSEAEPVMGTNANFAADYARTLGLLGASYGSPQMLEEAFARFEHLYNTTPNHLYNLQNWAIALYHVNDFASAWEKIKLVEQAGGGDTLDETFLKALSAQMPRP